ncbi:MAG: hypothetical protein F4X44_03295 [Gammaproteobacteria bacterium]|nr:hypothetical protein [Gammaproteobacteria bacterium]MYD79620.1 hypothetical protein [Gammaproteobacteria bacterium]
MKNYSLFGVLGLFIVAGAFVMGLVVAGGSESSTSSLSPRVSDSDTSKSDDSSAVLRKQDQNAVQSVAELATHDRFPSHFERSVALYELVAGADRQELLTHLRQSSQLAKSLKDEAQLAIIQRLAVIDPIAALDTVNESQPDPSPSLHSVIYREWAVSNLDQAIEHARSLDPTDKKTAVESMLMAREDLDPQQRRELARLLDMEWLAIELMEQTSDSPAIQDPKSEWAAFVRSNDESLDNPNNAQLRMMTHIAHAWVLKEGVDGFDSLIESLPTPTARQKISDLVVRQVTDDDPRLAFDLALHMRSIGFMGMLDQVVNEWSEDDPLSVLNIVSSLETKYLRGKLQTDVLQAWANTDPKTLLNQASELSVELQPFARSEALLSLAYRSPQEAAELIHEIEDQASLDRIANAVATNWSMSDLSSALRWIDNEESVAHNRDELRTAAIGGLARSDPQQAMQVALAQPVNDDGVGPEAEVISSITFEDMDTAVSLLAQVRDGKTKLEAYGSVLMHLTPPLSNETDRAMDLFVDLSNEQDIPSRSMIFITLVHGEPRALFGALDRFESMDFKRRVASSLLRTHEGDDVFTKEQISVLRETSQYGQESREARREAAFERVIELLEQSRDSDETESD